MSSLIPLSAPVQPTEDKPNEIHMIQGTTVNLADMMKAFWEFIKGFKPKYSGRHDRMLGLPTKAMPSPAVVEVLLYKGYLRSSAGLFFVFLFFVFSANSLFYGPTTALPHHPLCRRMHSHPLPPGPTMAQPPTTTTMP
jgi:hypothetical protein